MKSLLKKNSQSDCVFHFIIGMEEHHSPFPLGNFNRLFEDQIGVLFKMWHLSRIYFLNGINLAPNMSIYVVALQVKASWMQCPLDNKKVKQTCMVSMVLRGNWHHSISEHTKYSTYQLQRLVANVVYRKWRRQSRQNLLNSVFTPFMSVSVIACRSIGSCSGNGWCAGLPITGFHFQLLLTLPPSDTECQ